MQIKTFAYEQGRDPNWLNSSWESQIGDDHANDPDPLPARKTLALSPLVGGLTLLLDANRTPRTARFPSENSPAAFPAISEASGSMLGLAAVAVMLLLIGLAYIAEKVRHCRLNWKSTARVPHAPAHPPPNRASA